MKRRMWLAVSLVIILALLLSACGAEPTQPPPTEPPAATEAPAPTEAPPPTEAPAVAEAQPLVSTFIMWQGFIDLDPAYSYASENSVLNLCYENLTWYNPPGSDELLSPGLATAWEPNEDATEWTFTLREHVTFQDGTPFTAEAVKLTIDRYVERGGDGCTWIWDAVEEVEVIDDYTVKMKLSYSAPLDLIATSSYCGQIMSPSVIDKSKEWFDEGNCVGTGPYTIESHEMGQRLVMSRFDDYWQGWDDNQFEKIVFEIVNDPVVASQMIETGDADFWRDPQPDKAATLDAMDDINVYAQPSYQNIMYMLNTKKPPLDDPLVRQALAYSYPYDQYIERTEGLHTQARGAIPAGMWGHGEDLFQHTYDLEKAKELLAEAGYPDGGFELEISYMADVPAEAWSVELWSFPLAELGIELKPQAMTFDALWELAKSADPTTAQDIAVFMWWPTWVTPYDWLVAMYHCEEEPFFNVSYYCNEEFDAMIDEANVLTGSDREAAEAMFIDAQEILIKDSPAMFMFDLPSIWVTRADIEGLVDNPAYQNVVFYHDISTTR